MDRAVRAIDSVVTEKISMCNIVVGGGDVVAKLLDKVGHCPAGIAQNTARENDREKAQAVPVAHILSWTVGSSLGATYCR